MSDRDRRAFLKKSAAAAAALGITPVGAAAPAPQTNEPANASAGATQAPASQTAGGHPDGAEAGDAEAGAPQADATPTETLRAIGAAVLPTADLGEEGVERVVSDFEAWIAGFEPVAERPHGYLSRGLAEINYGPPHPRPRWASQVEALQLEAEKRHRTSFAALPVAARRALIEGQLGRGEYDRLPSPAQANHVALGLLAFFYDSSEATDLCYRAAIGRSTCRGLSGLGREPQPLGAPAAAESPRRRARADGQAARESTNETDRRTWARVDGS